jgi:hypothetical protein
VCFFPLYSLQFRVSVQALFVENILTLSDFLKILSINLYHLCSSHSPEGMGVMGTSVVITTARPAFLAV